MRWHRNEAAPNQKAETKGRGAAFISSLFSNNPEQQQFVLTVQNPRRLPSAHHLAEVIVSTASSLHESLYIDLEATFDANLKPNPYGLGNGERKIFNPACHYLVIGRRAVADIIPFPVTKTPGFAPEDLAA